MKSRKKSESANKRSIVFYDEQNDEFSTAKIEPKKIDGSYRYERTDGIRIIPHIFWYRCVAVPLAFCYLKFRFRHRVIGREKLKAAEGKGCFIYGNHTQIVADALIPTFVCFPNDASVIVHPNNVSMPFLGRVTPYMGALPLPGGMDAARNFNAVIKKRIEEKRAVFIYPEAHIWPYYTRIRPFGDDSFSYPVKHAAPVFCFTNVYKSRGEDKHPRLFSFVDGPFYPDGSLPLRERRKKLRDEVYAAMCKRAEGNEVAWIEYIDGRDNKEKEDQK